MVEVGHGCLMPGSKTGFCTKKTLNSRIQGLIEREHGNPGLDKATLTYHTLTKRIWFQ